MVRADSEGCAFKGSAEDILAEVAILMTRVAEQFTKDGFFDSKEQAIAVLVDTICGVKKYDESKICSLMIESGKSKSKKIPFEELMKEIKEEGK